MPIGSTLTNSVPAVGSSGTGYATAVNALLNEMKTAIEGTVPFSALSGSTLDMNNVPIIDAAYVAFYNTTGTPSATTPGRFVYSDGEMWAVNSTGAIQITSGGSLNAAAIGGIAGDYGSPNPASVQFVDAAWRYDFYDNYSALEFGYVRTAGVDIASGGHVATSNFAQLRYAGSSTLTFTLPSSVAAAAERSVLQISDAGVMSTNSSGTPLVGTIHLTGDINFSGNLVRSTRYIEYTPHRNDCYVTAGVLASNTNLVIVATGSCTFKVSLPPLPKNATITSITLKGYKTTGAALSAQLNTVTTGALGAETEVPVGSAISTSATGVYTATQGYTEVVGFNCYRLTMTLPAIYDSCWCIEIGLGGNL